MADKNVATPVAAIERDGSREHKEPCCIHTKKIYDACRERVSSRYKTTLKIYNDKAPVQV